MSKYDFLAIAVFLVLVAMVIISDAYELYYTVKCDKDRDMGFDDE